MPHPTKKQRIECHERRNEELAVADDDFLASFDDLADVLPNILGYLTPKDIMCKRRINKKSREAVRKTTVPLTDFSVDSLEKYNGMRLMTRAMPNLQQLEICYFEMPLGHKYNNGEDPDEEVATITADYTSHDIGIISNFSKLRMVEIVQAPLNGRYPVLFNFPLLQKLSIKRCYYLKWDLGMLAGFPLLKELDCWENWRLTGNISNLKVLKDTLEAVTIDDCPGVEGNLMDLADFPHLKELELEDTAVTGDIRDIGENGFSFLEQLKLPRGVYGANCCDLQRISDGPEFIRSVYLFGKQRPALKMDGWRGRVFGILSKDSPDWYESAENDDDDDETPPFYIVFVEAGSRIGYRWQTAYDIPCEVNWLDPEPERNSSDYEKYIKRLQQINSEVGLYRGFHQPPTEEEYHRLFED
jgi:hypothetical protein